VPAAANSSAPVTGTRIARPPNALLCSELIKEA
jgi:hypothetical protein